MKANAREVLKQQGNDENMLDELIKELLSQDYKFTSTTDQITYPDPEEHTDLDDEEGNFQPQSGTLSNENPTTEHVYNVEETETEQATEPLNQLPDDQEPVIKQHEEQSGTLANNSNENIPDEDVIEEVEVKSDCDNDIEASSRAKDDDKKTSSKGSLAALAGGLVGYTLTSAIIQGQNQRPIYTNQPTHNPYLTNYNYVTTPTTTNGFFQPASPYYPSTTTTINGYPSSFQYQNNYPNYHNYHNYPNYPSYPRPGYQGVGGTLGNNYYPQQHPGYTILN